MFSVFAPGSAQGAMPETLNYQGRMKLTSGAAVADSNSNSIEFRLYDDAMTGSMVWSETQSGVTTTAGLFNVQLGIVNPLSGLSFDQPYWLTLRFNGDTEMNPRTPLTAGPYAFRAKYADNVALPVPLLLSGDSASDAIISGDNSNATGTGIAGAGQSIGVSGTAFLGGSGVGVLGQANSTGGAGVKGVNPAGLGVHGDGNTGVYAHGAQFGVSVTASGATATGVIASVNSSNYGMRAINNGSGYGLLATGMTGVAGVAPFANAIGVLASSNGQVGAVALKVSGPAEFSAGPISFKNQVDFTGSTVTGIPVLSPPVNWTLAHGLPILTASNTGAGQGISAFAANDVAIIGQSPNAAGVAGASVAGYGVYAQSSTNAAVYASSTAGSNDGVIEADAYGAGAALLARGNAVAVSASAKDSGATAIYGYADFAGPGTTYGVRGLSQAQAGYGVHGLNSTPSGTGVYGYGGTGVWGEGFGGGGTGVRAWQGAGVWALDVSGSARFAAGTVDFSGATVTGLALGVFAPLALTESSATATVYAMNTAGGYALYGRAINGGANAAVYGFRGGVAGHSGVGVLGEISGTALSGATAIRAKDHSPNPGTYALTAESFNGVAISATALSETAIFAQNSSSVQATGDFLNNGTGPALRAFSQGSAPNEASIVGGNSTPGGVGIYATQYNSGVALQGDAEDGAGVLGQALGAPSGGVGVRGVGSNTNSVGVHGVGAGAPAVGVLAESVSGAALRLSGSALIDSASNTITMASYVSFTGGTNLGFAVPVPLSLSAGIPSGQVLLVEQTSNPGGYGIVAYNSSSASAAVFGQSLDTNLPGPGAGYGVVGMGPIGVFAQPSIDNGWAMMARASRPGSLAGYFDASNASSNGVWIRNQWGTEALHVETGSSYFGGKLTAAAGVYAAGSSVFDGAGNTTTFNTYVSFTAGTNLSSAVMAPLSLTLNSSVASPLSVSNASGTGGAFVGMTGIAVTGHSHGILASTTAFMGSAIIANSNSLSATVQVRNAYTGGAGVESIVSNSWAVLGETTASSPDGAIRGRNWGNGAGIVGDAFSGGTGVRGTSFVGVHGQATFANGVGVLADHGGIGTALALKVSGPARFELGSVTFSSHVDFSGATVTGLALGVPNPLFLSNTAASPVIEALNNGSGAAIKGFASAVGVSGIATADGGSGVWGVNTANSGTGAGVFGQASSTAGAGVWGHNNASGPGGVGVYGFSNLGYGVMGDSPNGFAGVYARNTSTGPGLFALGSTVGVSATAIGASGLGGYFQGVTGASAQGTSLGLFSNANAVPNAIAVAGTIQNAALPSVSPGSIGVYGASVNSFGIGLYGRATNATGSKAVIAEGGTIGLSATASGSGSHALVARANSDSSAADFINDGSGPAVFGRLMSGTNAVYWGEHYGNGPAFRAYNFGGGQGVFAQVTGVGAVGVRADAGSSVSGIGISALGSAAGVSASSNSLAGPGVYAQNTAGGPALRLGGSALMDTAPGLSITVASYVSFTAGTNLSMAGGPLSVTASVLHPGAVFYGVNSGTGHGVFGAATQPGWGGAGATVTAGVFGYSSNSLSAGVLARNTYAGLQAAGVFAEAANAYIGESNYPDGSGGDFKGNSGTGVKARGVTGLAATSSSLGGLGARIAAYNMQDRALEVEGSTSLLADNNGFALSVTQSSGQFGAGAIMAYSAASGTAAIRALNTNPEGTSENSVPGVGVWAEGTIGIAAFSNNAGGMGLYAQAGPTTVSAAIRAEQTGGGFAVEAEANSGVAIYARGVTGLAAFSYATGGTALFAYGSLSGKALVVEGNSRFNEPSSSAQTQFFGQVDFTGATVSGIVATVPNPLFLSNNILGAVIEAQNNTPNGAAFRGSVFADGAVAFDATANSTNSAAIRVNNNNGARGIEVNAVGGNGIFVSGSQPGGSAIYSTALAFGSSAIEGIANTGNAIGVNAQAYDVSATALRAVNYFGGPAFRFDGGGQFNGPGSVSFSSHVDFSGALVTGLSGGVSAPLSLSGTTGSPIISGTNFFPNSVGVFGENMNGTGDIGVMGRVSGTGSNNAAGVLGAMSNTMVIPFGGAGVVGDGGEAGHGVYGRSSRGDRAAIYAQQASPSAQAVAVLGEVVPSGEPVVGVLGTLQMPPIFYMPTTSTAVFGWGDNGGHGVHGATFDNDRVGVLGQHRNGGVGGIAILGEDSGFNGYGVVGSQSLHLSKNDFNFLLPGGAGVVGTTGKSGGYGVAGLVSGPAQAALYGRHLDGGLGLWVESNGALAAGIGASLTSSGEVVALAVSSTTLAASAGTAIGLSVSADFMNFVGHTAKGAVISARGDWETVGVSVTARSVGPLNRPGYGIYVDSDRTGIRALALDATANSPAGFAVIGEGARVGVYGVATWTAGAPGSFSGIGVLAESSYVALSVVAVPDMGSNSGVAIYAAGRMAGIFNAEFFDSSGTVTGLSLSARNLNNAGSAGATGLALNAVSNSFSAPAIGISLTATGGNGGSGQSTTGLVAEAVSSGNVAYGVVGRLGSFQPGAGVRGEANIQATFGGHAGVQAVNLANASMGNPSPALDIDGGITMVTSRVDNSAGQVSVFMGGGSGSNPCIQNGNTIINSNQILANSLILLTPVYNGALQYPITARISNQANGQATVEAHVVGQGGSCPGVGNVTVNYLIINQR